VDHWDMDHPFERYLIDTAMAPDKSEVLWINQRIRPGERRKVLTGIPGKTGATGEVTVNPASTFSPR